MANDIVTTQSLPSFFPVLTVPTAIDYTSKDWTAFVTSMLNYAQIVMPDWDTSSQGDFGVMMVELLAYGLDILSFYGDRLTQEAYLPTATQRLSILNLARLLGYVPANGSPSSGTVTFQTTANPGPAVVVPAGTQVATGFAALVDQPVIFQTTQDITVPDNGGTATVDVIQGVTFTQKIIGTSNGTAGQVFQIAQPFVEDGTTTIFVSGEAGLAQWNQVTFLVDSGPDDLTYSLFVDENNVTNIQFGDNVNGAIPGIGLTIFATYTVGVGSSGNVPAGSVGVLVTPLTGVIIPFQSADSTLYQSTEMAGGSDPETNDQIRANAPMAYATQQRAVSTNDFQNLALSIPGILEASAVANHSTSVTLYVLGPNYMAPSAPLENIILDFFQDKMLAGVTLSVGTPDLVLVDVGSSGSPVTVNILPNYSQAVVLANVTTALQAILSPPVTQFGMQLNVSAIYSAIMAVAGVNYALVPLFTREDVTQATTNPIQFRPSEIPVAGTIFLTGQGGIGS